MEAHERAFPLWHVVAPKYRLPLTEEPAARFWFSATVHSMAPPGRTFAGTQEEAIREFVPPMLTCIRFALITSYCCELDRNNNMLPTPTSTSWQ